MKERVEVHLSQLWVKANRQHRKEMRIQVARSDLKESAVDYGKSIANTIAHFLNSKMKISLKNYKQRLQLYP